MTTTPPITSPPITNAPITGAPSSRLSTTGARSRVGSRCAAVTNRATATASNLRRRVVTGTPERGDVPGWVLVTLMSALLVVALIGVARGQLTSVFQNAINSVSGP